ncbi:MAG TPA: phosphoenolpyruvate--protein phosphotransferase [Gemmataceae bacterium]|jgi:phosphoenolpyruvate-protein phosphotransferase|nr:phosphoenolpyruvate--protein phosphotransferase [Gemmataceae bacterium]
MTKKGIPVSPGVAVARAYLVDEVLARREPHHLDKAAVSAEILRFENALNAAVEQLDAIIERVRTEISEDQAGIFRGHRLIVRDPALVGRVKSAILNKQLDARSALLEALDDYKALFEKIDDDYIRERMTDIRDVVGRIANQLVLTDPAPKCLQRDEPVILVAAEILPSQAVWFDRFKVAGILTEGGGSTGHAAILARSRGIPSISGLAGIRKEIKTGDLIAMDGRSGHVHLKPDAELETAYRKLEREYFFVRDRLIENRELQAISPDGAKIELLANVNNVADAQTAANVGAVGVGLYRTEYLFLTHPTVPSEEEQLAAYKAVIEAAPNRFVTIRTLDIGGDKLVPYFEHNREANPFMGWRSIRLSTAYPDFFITQIRAILRAAEFGNVELLFPMVSSVEEVRAVKKLVARAADQLRGEGLPFGASVPIGVMMEVPAAALCIDSLLTEVDFVSIGSNDLIQYVMAADRDNPKVAHLCEPFNPALMRLLAHIIRHCVRANKPVTLCGEMAARPRCYVPLLGMGLRRFSMSPAFVPTVKEAVRTVPLERAKRIAARVLRLRTFRAIRTYLTRVTTKLCPSLTMLDTKK